MTIERKLLGTTPVSGEVLPEAVSFDGTNDSMNRTSDLTGNSNGKTFTFSCWFYTGTSAGQYKIYQAGNSTFNVQGGSEFVVYFKNSSNTTVFQVDANPLPPINTWCHICLSVDLANTSNRYLYLNDELVNATWTKYINDNLYFSQAIHNVGSYTYDSNELIKGRLAHLFLDYTYRDLSTTSNRRLFIDADGKPSSTIPSSPILYLPMTDAATAGSNSGTGGDFTVNGVLATAERGPNQDNCSASTFDGSADYLRISGALTGATNNKLVTVSFSFNPSAGSGSKIVIGGGSPLRINIRGESTRWLFDLSNTSGGNILTWQDGTGVVPDRMNHVTLSCDLSDTSKRHVFVNGVATATTPSTYTNSTIDHSFSIWEIGRRPSLSSHYYAGTLGELYYDNTYTDLATENPFWDSDANRPNSVRKVIADTSVTPLIALPIMGNDAGNNLGSGGDFTVNSGPFTGARGGSEFWARSAKFNGTSGYLAHATALTGAVDNQVFSAMFAFRNSNITLEQNILHTGNGTNHGLSIYQAGNDLGLLVYKDTTDLIMVANTSSGGALFSANTWYVVFVSYDRGNSSNRNIWVNGLDCSSYPTDTEWVSSTGAENIWHDDTNITIGAKDTGTGYYQYHGGDIATLYFNNSYIDFSQEANRNKFVDQLGYPIDLTSAIETGDIPEPLIYMKFDDTAALGTNSGTGGNFTVNGTVTSGADFTP
jgi:hypothetical protein